ncbi:hypothetical protein Acr_00g0038900 [Actinidia rufa]|uniref:Reverse transcriptase zinc-binding domain-containing protein n=1 Tax=Actinidia rufa TaxID=165716 RepID=A0A7J0DHF8_9ERIC|nr:hypothetical protein Acr_00g0038900 [Actinidia rufa]
MNGKLVDDGQATELMRATTDKEIKESLFRISREDLESIKSVSGFTVGRLPFRYLGLPVSSTKLTIAQFQPFTDRISGHLNTWTSLKLSYAGRCELISSVLQGVECFWLASLPIPTGIRERLIRMCRNFLWGGKCFVSKKPLVAWDSICLPKMEGGLGFKNLEAWNLALLSKNLWNIQAKKDTLWIRWVHQHYLQNTSIWEYTGNKRDSAMMKQMLLIRDKIFAMDGSMQAVSNRMGQWVLEGRFHSNLAYEFFRPRKEIITWPKMVWSSCIMPKHSFILWLGLKDRLLTRDKIQEFSEDTSCPLCTNLDESVDHLFFQCNVAKQGVGNGDSSQGQENRACMRSFTTFGKPEMRGYLKGPVPISFAVDASCCRADLGMMLVGAYCCCPPISLLMWGLVGSSLDVWLLLFLGATAHC